MQLPSGAVSLRFRKHSLARRLVAAVGDLSSALGRLVGVLLVLADDLDTTLLVGDNADRLRRNLLSVNVFLDRPIHIRPRIVLVLGIRCFDYSGKVCTLSLTKPAYCTVC